VSELNRHANVDDDDDDDDNDNNNNITTEGNHNRQCSRTPESTNKKLQNLLHIKRHCMYHALP
jgi:hypothetical protein